MKRKNFDIKINGKSVATKHAFNTARREIRNQIINFATVGDTWEMIDEHQEFDGPNRIATFQNWKNQNGDIIQASVTLITH